MSGEIQTAGQTGRKVVLVVDDEAMVRMLAVELFEEIGCDVLEASGGAEALAVLEQRPDVSLMFTDCRMPGMSGPELARELRSRRPELPVLIVSGYAEAEGIGSSMPRLTKPFRNAELAASLTDLMPAPVG